jgi:uncharacterized protein YodC (DUF2158 family)
MRRLRIENAEHAALISLVERGSAAIVAEQFVDGRRVQLAACALGDEIKLSNWTEDARGAWVCASSMSLPIWALPDLAWLIRRPPPSTSKAAETLGVGDIVRHKSGGPRMEISGLSSRGVAWCAWTVNGETRTAPYELDELIAAKPLLAR